MRQENWRPHAQKLRTDFGTASDRDQAENVVLKQQSHRKVLAANKIKDKKRESSLSPLALLSSAIVTLNNSVANIQHSYAEI